MLLHFKSTNCLLDISIWILHRHQKLSASKAHLIFSRHGVVFHISYSRRVLPATRPVSPSRNLNVSLDSSLPFSLHWVKYQVLLFSTPTLSWIGLCLTTSQNPPFSHHGHPLTRSPQHFRVPGLSRPPVLYISVWLFPLHGDLWPALHTLTPRPLSQLLLSADQTVARGAPQELCS